jgi:hypothetical protein
MPRAVRSYFRARERLGKVHSLLDACFAGVWLGLLDAKALHALDGVYYDQEKMYCHDAYNRRGFWAWEQEMVDSYFQPCKRILVGSAGGGREILALARRGYAVDGFECNPTFVAYANALLEKEGLPPSVRHVARDATPKATAAYDGIIVGWSGYMLIQGRARRIAFLRQLRTLTRDGAPLLVSFFARTGIERRFKVITAIGNAFRHLLGRERLQLGDDLDPNYVHYFTKAEIASEFEAAGFGLAYFGTRGYGHAVGLASPLREAVSSSAAAPLA